MDKTFTQTKDGRWIPAQPIPYFRDTRPIIVKLWHCFLSVYGILRYWNSQKRELMKWLIKK